MAKNILVGLVLLVVGGAGAYVYLLSTRPESDSAPRGDLCAAHGVPDAKCPWCDPSLVERLGPCPEHGVPEALCATCNPFLVPGFEAENDWCAGHSVPESQCDLCQAGILPPGEREARSGSSGEK